MKKNTRMITTADVAKMADVCKATVIRWSKKTDFPKPVKCAIGNKNYFEEVKVLEWFNKYNIKVITE